MTNNLSNKWRLQKSNIPAIELANSLKALRKVIGMISPDSESITFGGSQSYNMLNRKHINISIKYALRSGKFPIPPEDFDVLVGLAAHEAGHTKSEPISVEMLKSELPRNMDRFTLQYFLDIAEEIYTDALVKRMYPVHGEYLTKAREAYLSGESEDYSNIGLTWSNESIYNMVCDKTQIKGLDAPIHAMLLNLTEQLQIEWPLRARINLYNNTYQAIVKLLQAENIKSAIKSQVENSASKTMAEDMTNIALSKMGLEPPNRYEMEKHMEKTLEKLLDIPHDTQDTSNKSSGDFHTKSDIHNKPEVKQLINDAMAALESDTEDMTSIVNDAVKSDIVKSPILTRKGPIPTVYKKSTNKSHSKIPDPQLVKELDWVRRIHNIIGRQVFRGMEEGVLDRRRLHRHYIDDKVKKQSKITRRQELDIVLLLDASISMDNKQEIYNAAIALHHVLRKQKIQVLSYNSPNSTNVITNHTTNKGIIGEITPDGGTPSGQALIVTALKFPKSLIIHFTDGEANRSMSPKDALDVIGGKYPSVHIVNVIYSNRFDVISQSYTSSHKNHSVMELKKISDFPELLREELKPWYQV